MDSILCLLLWVWEYSVLTVLYDINLTIKDLSFNNNRNSYNSYMLTDLKWFSFWPDVRILVDPSETLEFWYENKDFLKVNISRVFLPPCKNSLNKNLNALCPYGFLKNPADVTQVVLNLDSFVVVRSCFCNEKWKDFVFSPMFEYGMKISNRKLLPFFFVNLNSKQILSKRKVRQKLIEKKPS